ncbi:CDC50 family protein-like protein [Tricladium varicosporioides]|nr:CDC50 family protein-like protein [Hymenoscyphus varicosporioides]
MADQQPVMVHPDSIDSQDPHSQPEPAKQKSRRPANTAFRQQRLKAWQPILTPKTVLPLFFAIGIIFAPIGGGLLYASAVVNELSLDYSRCHLDAPDAPAFADMPSSAVESHFTKSTFTGVTKWQKEKLQVIFPGNVSVDTTRCTLNFYLKGDMVPPIYFYYRLTNFYQNHRRYAKSFNTDQLSGKAVSAGSVHSSDCTPLTTAIDPSDNVTKPYYPCGLAANSLFNDTFYNPIAQNEPGSSEPNGTTIFFSKSGISWSSDRALYGKSAYDLTKDVLVPPNWSKRYGGDHYKADNQPDLQNDEAFQVWMRLAGLPTFSKLAQKNENHTMQAGQYYLSIDSHFPVTEYGGTKSVILSTGTVMGGRNPFLGIAYVVVGGICIVLGTLFTVTHLIKPRKLGDHTYLSWNNETAHASATTSGRDGVLAGERGGA